MRPGRPSKRLEHIDALTGDEEQKARLRALLATLTGEHTLREAAEMLGLGESRIHQLRRLALQGALEGIAPRPAGRPAQEVDERDERISELEERLSRAEAELQLARARTELALLMPHVLEEQAKKGGPQALRRLPETGPKGADRSPKKARRKQKQKKRRR